MPDTWVTVASFSQPIEAHLLRTKLESEGIECQLKDEHIVRMDWFYSNAVGGVKVQVREEDVARVRALLDSLPPTTVSSAPQPCPACGALAGKPDRQLWKIALCFLFLGLPFPYLRRKRLC